MTFEEQQEDATIYNVVVNHEEQYSIWPTDRDLPLGWEATGKEGLKDECLAHIEEVWTDMRPLSLRKKMEELARQREADDKEQAQEELALSTRTIESYRDPLIQHLSEGNHPVIASRADNSVEKFKESINRGYVLIKFTDTKGGTELGLKLDNDNSDFSQADFEQGQGVVHLEGNLTLNYTKVRCLVDIELTTLTGKGHLKILE